MSAGINISFASDVRAFLAGTDNIEKSLDDVSSSLDDLSREAATSGDKAARSLDGLGDALDGSARDAKQAADKIGSAMDGAATDAKQAGNKIGDALDGAGDEAKQAGKKIGDGIDAGTDDAESSVKALEKTFRQSFDDASDAAKKAGKEVEGSFDGISSASSTKFRKPIDEDTSHFKRKMGEVTEEGHDTAREMFASFQNVSSLQDAAQEIAANAGAIFGPIGLAVGGLLSVGIAKFTQNWGKAKEELKQQTSQFLSVLTDAKGKITETDIGKAISDTISSDPAAWAKQKRQLNDLGVNWQDFIRARSGDKDALGRVKQAIEDNNSALQDQVDALNQSTQGQSGYGLAVGDNNTKQKDLNEKLAQGKSILSGLTTTQDALNDAQTAYNDIAATTSETQDSLNGEYADLADSADIYSAAVQRASDKNKDHKLTIDDIIAEQKKAQKAQTDFADNMDVVRKRFGDAGAQMVADAGEDGPAVAQALADGPKKKGAEAVANYKKLGSSARAGMKSGVQPDKPFTIPVNAKAGNSAAAREALQRYFNNNPVSVAITAKVYASQAARVRSELASIRP